MQKPKMILFDYGQTLANEAHFDGEKATAALMAHAVQNKYGRTPQDIQAQANYLNQELGRFDPTGRNPPLTEIPFAPFEAYLLESNGIQLSISYSEAEQLFWDTAAPGVPTDGIEKFLHDLKGRGIRTGVISNLSYSGKALSRRITQLLPHHDFSFILVSSDYLFRKPAKQIFTLALEKTGLSAEEVWYVGDNYTCDVLGAKNAGLFPVWYTGFPAWYNEAENAIGKDDNEILKIENWEQLREYIDSLT